MTVVINGTTGISPVTAAGTSALVDGMTVGRGAGEVATNTAVGASALQATTTGDLNTAVGYQASYSSLTGAANSAFGYQALYSNTGSNNTAIGYYSLRNNTTGGSNIAVGQQALASNTTASSNTAVGYQAGYTNTTGANNTFVGRQAGYAATTAQGNVFIGDAAGIAVTTGYANTFIGPNWSAGGSCGGLVTTGYKNTIIGAYTGNQGGLDIRTASNKVVLSDGDGNPVFTYGAYPTGAGTFGLNSGYATLGLGGTGTTGTGVLFLNAEQASGWGPVIEGYTNGTFKWVIGSNSFIKGGTTYDTFTVQAGASGGVNLAATGTSWTSASDQRLKDIIEPITDAANKVSTLRAVIGKYKTDSEGTRRSFLIAQDVQAVLPEAVTESRNSKDDDTEYLQLSYTDVIPLLVAAIKELKAEFDAYKEAHP